MTPNLKKRKRWKERVVEDEQDDGKISARILVGTGHYIHYMARRARAGSSIFKKGSASNFLLGFFFCFFFSNDTQSSSEKFEVTDHLTKLARFSRFLKNKVLKIRRCVAFVKKNGIPFQKNELTGLII